MVAFTGNDPRNAVVKNGDTFSGVGLVLTNDGTANKVKIGAAGTFALGVTAGESSRDADQVLETAGATVSYFPMGGVLMVAALAETYTTGQKVYLKGANRVGGTAGSDKLVGIYVGEGEVVGTAGLLIPVNTNSAIVA
tara:strand:+ start:1054 stop:1467 length:414 start_codon:yes stop_codon:yes gene_type:complete